MSEEKFDAIVVGAGVAGCVAAYVLAKEGLDVLVIERGNYAGSKNMTGGRLYAHSLERVMPGFAEEAPVERLVTREKISFITDDDSVTLDYHTGEAFSAEAASYTVLRGKFDQWLQEKAESEGAQFIPGIRVDRLLQDETGRVTGVQAGFLPTALILFWPSRSVCCRNITLTSTPSALKKSLASLSRSSMTALV